MNFTSCSNEIIKLFIISEKWFFLFLEISNPIIESEPSSPSYSTIMSFNRASTIYHEGVRSEPIVKLGRNHFFRQEAFRLPYFALVGPEAGLMDITPGTCQGPASKFFLMKMSTIVFFLTRGPILIGATGLAILNQPLRRTTRNTIQKIFGTWRIEKKI